jgi:GxxExxY protein
MEINEISGQIVDTAMKVHSALGPGLLESAYEGCLMFELVSRGIGVLRQVELPVIASMWGTELTCSFPN